MANDRERDNSSSRPEEDRRTDMNEERSRGTALGEDVRGLAQDEDEDFDDSDELDEDEEGDGSF
jgi:hypothetical protein